MDVAQFTSNKMIISCNVLDKQVTDNWGKENWGRWAGEDAK